MLRSVRPISWVKAARKAFLDFPITVQNDAASALTVIAAGQNPDIAKPMKGLGAGVWELALRRQGDAFRVVYALQIDEELWVIHAFQKKSKSGIATPKPEIDLVRERIRRLKETLK